MVLTERYFTSILTTFFKYLSDTVDFMQCAIDENAKLAVRERHGRPEMTSQINSATPILYFRERALKIPIFRSFFVTFSEIIC